MNSVITYLIQVAIAQTILMACYWLLLRRDTFYKMNRWYFLGGFVLSFFIPFINVDIQQWFATKDASVKVTVVYQYIPNLSFSNIEQHWWQQFSSLDMGLIIMALGTCMMLFKMLIQYLSLKKLNTRQQTSFDAYNIQLIDQKLNPFSFGKTIYLNPQLHSEHELEEIIEHELVHILQKHSIDILAALANRCLFWWNPAAWLLNKAIRNNLEFIADNMILEKGFDRKHYQYHLLRISQLSYSNSMAHHFNFTNLKKRIVMMNKKKSHPLLQAKWLLLVPITAMVLVSFNDRGNILHTMKHSFATDTVPAVPPIAPIAPLAPPSASVAPIAPLAPIAPDAPVAPINMPEDIRRMDVNNQKVIITFKDGKIENYDLNDAKQKALLEKKYGKLPIPPLPPKAPTKKEVSTIDKVETKKIDVLYIVDGVESNSVAVAAINPAQIASVDVLNAATAYPIYGKKGENGVVKIFTKTIVADNAIAKNITASPQKNINVAVDQNYNLTPPKNSPLYIVDEKEMKSEDFDRLVKPEQIESINVLKGAEAEKKYGSKGVYGVLEIKTKKNTAKPVQQP